MSVVSEIRTTKTTTCLDIVNSICFKCVLTLKAAILILWLSFFTDYFLGGINDPVLYFTSSGQNTS